jgi:hydrogenase nickel incorporation protein HypB
MIFAGADVVIINKLDFIPYLDFIVRAFHQAVEGLNPEVKFFQVSCKTGAGIENWCSWLLKEMEKRNRFRI